MPKPQDNVKQLKHTPPHIHFKCKYFKWNNTEIYIISRKICNYVL
uniref:GM02923p n=1 Tax=Drosophila melanogaster TaxID=7227 RepID=Q8T954_DROME|nr:GM02923p [Drosophila melanogaster]